MKLIKWLGDSRNAVKSFSDAARYQAGIELFAIQLGTNPSDWKPMRSIGAGVNEIRIHAENEYRVLYVAKFAGAVYVLHAFTKKTQTTSLPDVNIARQRYRNLLAQRGKK